MEIFNLSTVPSILRANIQGQNCNLIVTDTPKTAPEMAMVGDATINCFAMSAEDRKIFTHPDALQDLKDRRFRMRINGQYETERSVDRFRRIGRRYREETGAGLMMRFD